MSLKLKVFLDTTVLLKGFAAFKSAQPLPRYLLDASAERYTFEKCVFEAYMALRGVGGKKPDEGRGQWAERYLRAATDPASVGKLASQVHRGDTQTAFYWINQILESGCGVDEFERHISSVIQPHDREQAWAEAAALRQLVAERGKFDALCWHFNDFLEHNGVSRLNYGSIFAFDRRTDCTVDASTLDGFVRDTVIPSEDFEIVYAALVLPADVFVTDDNRLRTCAMSLGLNLPLSGWHFCRGENYEKKVAAIRALRDA